MSDNDVAIVPVKEVLEPFIGRQLLEKIIGELKVKTATPELPQVIMMTPDQLRTMNMRAQAADYFIQKVQKMAIGLEAYDSRNERNKLTLLINELHDFATQAKEPGDDDALAS